MISLSTAWNYRSGIDMRQLLSEIKAAGVDTIELGYKITVDELAQILPLLKEFDIRVSSVHNFCPLPNDHPSSRHPSNHYRLSSIDEAERKLAVKWTQEAVNTARKANAGVVVIHAGMIELPEEIAEGLFKKYKESGKGAPDFPQLRERFIKERSKAKGPFMKALVESLKEVMKYAKDHGIKIGLETRYYPTEIPNHEEIGELLDLFHKDGMWYWHDVGHGEVNERLGIYNHLETLKRYQDQLIGFHLHGVDILKDHRAPFAGDFDLKSVYPFIRKHHVKVIESHSSATAEDIRYAVKELAKLETK